MDVREKLVKQAISHFWYGVSHDIFSEPVTTYAKLAIEALEKEKESGVTLQEWISVDNRLPSDEQDVLVIAHGWGGRFVYVGSHKRVEAQKSWLTGITNKSSEWSLWGWSYLKEPIVTHWLPMPEPPEEGICNEKV